MQVVTDDALNATVDDAVQTTRDQARAQGHRLRRRSSASTPPRSAVEGVEPARVKDMRDILRDFFREGWEIREAGEGRFVVEMSDRYVRADPSERTVKEAIRRWSAASTSSASRSP